MADWVLFPCRFFVASLTPEQRSQALSDEDHSFDWGTSGEIARARKRSRRKTVIVIGCLVVFGTIVMALIPALGLCGIPLLWIASGVWLYRATRPLQTYRSAEAAVEAYCESVHTGFMEASQDYRAFAMLSPAARRQTGASTLDSFNKQWDIHRKAIVEAMPGMVSYGVMGTRKGIDASAGAGRLVSVGVLVEVSSSHNSSQGTETRTMVVGYEFEALEHDGTWTIATPFPQQVKEMDVALDKSERRFFTDAATLERAASEYRPPDRNLVKAIEANDVLGVRFLLKDGVDPNESWGGPPPLTAAAMRGRLEIVRLLLDRGAKDPGEALATACITSDCTLDVVGLLLDRGADLGAKSSVFGGTAIANASHTQSPEIVRLLLARGAKFDDKVISGCALRNLLVLLEHGAPMNRVLENALHALPRDGKRDEADEMVDELMRRGADPNQALAHCIGGKDVDRIVHLVGFGADPDSPVVQMEIRSIQERVRGDIEFLKQAGKGKDLGFLNEEIARLDHNIEIARRTKAELNA